MCIKARNREIQKRLQVPETNITKVLENLGWALYEFNCLRKTKKILTADHCIAMEPTIPIFQKYLENTEQLVKTMEDTQEKVNLYSRYKELEEKFQKIERGFYLRKKRKEEQKRKNLTLITRRSYAV